MQLRSGETHVPLGSISIKPPGPPGATCLPNSCRRFAGNSRTGRGLGHWAVEGMDEKNYWVNKNPGSRGGSAAKTPKVRETQVQPLGQEDPHLEKEMAALCCILA